MYVANSPELVSPVCRAAGKSLVLRCCVLSRGNSPAKFRTYGPHPFQQQTAAEHHSQQQQVPATGSRQEARVRQQQAGRQHTRRQQPAGSTHAPAPASGPRPTRAPLARSGLWNFMALPRKDGRARCWTGLASSRMDCIRFDLSDLECPALDWSAVG